jgi:hypothetical protein
VFPGEVFKAFDTDGFEFVKTFGGDAVYNRFDVSASDRKSVV